MSLYPSNKVQFQFRDTSIEKFEGKRYSRPDCIGVSPFLEQVSKLQGFGRSIIILKL